MVDSLNGPTVDLSHARTSADRAEKRTQAAGLWCSGAGAAILAAVVICWLIWPKGTQVPDADGWVLATVFLLIGATLVGVGVHERVHRSARQRTLEEASTTAAAQVALVRQVDELGQMVSQQMTIIGAAIDAIAEALPEHDRVRDWRAYNQGVEDTVRKGFLQSTGTFDGRTTPPPAQRPRNTRLGLVKRDKP